MGGGRLGFSRVRLSYRQANRPHHFQTMPRRKRKSPLPLLLAELSFASWETIHRRTLMMARGACSPAEYSRMIGEKIAAATQTAAAFTRARRTPKLATLLGPWHKRATANARRLRRK